MENTIDLMSIFDHDSQFQSLMKRMLERPNLDIPLSMLTMLLQKSQVTA
jgi:hypothetical protein